MAFYLVNEQEGNLNDRIHMISHSLASTCLSFCYVFEKVILRKTAKNTVSVIVKSGFLGHYGYFLGHEAACRKEKAGEKKLQ